MRKLVIGNALYHQLSVPSPIYRFLFPLAIIVLFPLALVEEISHFLFNPSFSSHALDSVHFTIPGFLLFYVTSLCPDSSTSSFPLTLSL